MPAATVAPEGCGAAPLGRPGRPGSAAAAWGRCWTRPARPPHRPALDRPAPAAGDPPARGRNGRCSSATAPDRGCPAGGRGRTAGPSRSRGAPGARGRAPAWWPRTAPGAAGELAPPRTDPADTRCGRSSGRFRRNQRCRRSGGPAPRPAGNRPPAPGPARGRSPRGTGCPRPRCPRRWLGWQGWRGAWRNGGGAPAP